MADRDLVEEMLEAYPGKTMKKRRKHIVKRDSQQGKQKIKANQRSIPGIMTNRGCCYAGCKGVVGGPVKDMVHIVHGPIGCSYYAWKTRRNKGKAQEGNDNFLNYCFSTDMQDTDVVFGGEKKLEQAIEEAVEIFDPWAIGVYATCPIGLIGDDIDAVAKRAQEKYEIPVLSFDCEGYKGVSQSAGHHIANNEFMKDLIGKKDKETGKYSVNILGEYNIGGDAWEICRVLEKIGYEVVSIMTGDSSFREIQSAHEADLNLVMCYRSINYIADMFDEKFGLPWLKINFIGPDAMAQSLRDMAQYFGDEELIERTEEVIGEEMAEINDELDQYKEIAAGETAILFVGGSRAHHYQNLFRRIGIEPIVVGHEFGHRDDYEGREVLSDIKKTADDQNIPELEVTQDDKRYQLRLSKEKLEELKEEIPLEQYEGMIKEVKNGNYVIDDYNHHETVELIEKLNPSIYGSGIKDKYVAHKMGVFSKQMHSYDYSGPYAGFKGAINFAEDIIAGLTTPAWSYITPPWKDEVELKGRLGGML